MEWIIWWIIISALMCIAGICLFFRVEKIAADISVIKNSATNKQSNQPVCPWAEDGDCSNVNIKCTQCIRNTLYNDYAAN